MEKAVVVTAEGGPAEVVEPGVTGLLADPRDPAAWAGAIAELLDDARRARVGAAARAAVVERFERGAYVTTIVGLYRAALAGSRSVALA